MKRLALYCLAMVATPAVAQGVAAESPPPGSPALRELCSERPGLTTAACTVDPGHVQIEVGFGNWTLDSREDEREDRIEAGDILLRYGLGRTTEVQLGWIAYGHVRTLDRTADDVSTSQGTGDVTLALKQNLRHPAEGKTGFAVALLPSVTLPVGSGEVGQGDWSAGLVIPASYKLNDTISFALSPEIDAAVDQDRSGRHLAYGAAVAVQVHLTEALRLSPEVQFIRDEDPDGRTTLSVASLSLDVRAAKMTQFDIQAVAGLNADTPDLKLSCGISHKF
ncbi:MAG: transporter [Sphingobium sp.]